MYDRYPFNSLWQVYQDEVKIDDPPLVYIQVNEHIDLISPWDQVEPSKRPEWVELGHMLKVINMPFIHKEDTRKMWVDTYIMEMNYHDPEKKGE